MARAWTYAHDGPSARRLLTAIRIPATWANAEFYFEKIRDRPVWDFPLINVASAAEISGGKIDSMRIAVNRSRGASGALGAGGDRGSG